MRTQQISPTASGRAFLVRGMLCVLATLPVLAGGCAGATPAPTTTALRPEEPYAPMVEVEDQDASAGTIVIKRIVSDGPGLLIIHDRASNYDVGYAPVVDGENPNVAVEIDLDLVTPLLFAHLHVDKGIVGVYEAPIDASYRDVDGSPISPPFNVTLQPSVSVIDQPVAHGTVTIDRVVAVEPGWLAIHSAVEGNPVIGVTPVDAWVSSKVVVEVDEISVTDTLIVMLHVDAGTVGEFEFPGGDVPVQIADQVVTSPFSTVVNASVTVNDQALSRHDTVTIELAIMLQDGWLAIHSDAEGSPVIGFTPLKAGLNRNVAVLVDPSSFTDSLLAMLHVDEGLVGEFEFPDADLPIIVNGASVAAAFMVTK